MSVVRNLVALRASHFSTCAALAFHNVPPLRAPHHNVAKMREVWRSKVKFPMALTSSHQDLDDLCAAAFVRLSKREVKAPKAVKTRVKQATKRAAPDVAAEETPPSKRPRQATPPVVRPVSPSPDDTLHEKQEVVVEQVRLPESSAGVMVHSLFFNLARFAYSPEHENLSRLYDRVWQGCLTPGDWVWLRKHNFVSNIVQI